MLLDSLGEQRTDSRKLNSLHEAYALIRNSMEIMWSQVGVTGVGNVRAVVFSALTTTYFTYHAYNIAGRANSEEVTLPDYFDLVKSEVRRAMSKFPPLASGEEAVAVIQEEVDEFWQQVRMKNRNVTCRTFKQSPCKLRLCVYERRLTSGYCIPEKRLSKS
jgi:hypothetical protein